MANRALAFLFVAGIAVPCLGTLVALDTGRIPGENRKLADTPTLTKGKLKEYPKRVEAWFSDFFGLRNSLVRANGLLHYRVLRVSSSKQVVIGKDGWLFYASAGILESRRGLIPFSEEELRTWQSRIEERRDWLASRGIAYVFMLAPEKSSLYPEMLPDYLKPVRDVSRYDQFVAWMGAHSTVNVLDLRKSLLAAKAEGRIWYLTDSHWNDAGAFAAYHQIASWLAARFPGVIPRAASGFSRRLRVRPGGDLAGMLAIREILPEETIALEPTTPLPAQQVDPSALMLKREWAPLPGPTVYQCQSGSIPRAVVLHDSFFAPIRPLLATHFGRVAYLWSLTLPLDIIIEEEPQILIDEMVERHLGVPGFFPVNEPRVSGSTQVNPIP